MMTDIPNVPTRIRQAALDLAAAQPWADVSLASIAAKAEVTLADLASHYASKAEILLALAREIDGTLLKSLETDPVEGGPHDRLFDVMLRRFELLAPYKAALRSIAAAPASGPQEWLNLLNSTLQSQSWILAAAGLEAKGMRGDLSKLGLARIYADTMRIWLDDDDPGLARTMAALDRKLRDGEAFMRRLETPIAFVSGLARAVSAFRNTRTRERPAPDATAD
jgi:ubiquinone biosynthesis protein COQ9